MATDKDTQLAQDIIAQQINIFRFSAGEQQRVLRILKRMEEDLVGQLLHANLTDISREDKARLLSQAQAVIEQYYGDMSEASTIGLEGLARTEAQATADALDRAFQGHIVPALPTETYFKRLVDKTMIQGATNADWWSRQSTNYQWQFQTEISQGLAQGETNAQLIQRVRGKAVGYKVVDGERVYEYAGGLMQKARAAAAAEVQTAVQTVAATARRDTFQANSDVIKGIRQVSTLDGHTTVICVAYSGAKWTLEYVPITPTTLAYNGGVPRHWNCRSVEVPITKTFRELGIDIPEFQASTRAASGGPVSAKTEFADYLKQRGPAFTNDLLGPGRAQLWHDGKITLQQLLDQNGRPLTLDELRKRYGQ